jgi:hypothetical protein
MKRIARSVNSSPKKNPGCAFADPGEINTWGRKPPRHFVLVSNSRLAEKLGSVKPLAYLVEH